MAARTAYRASGKATFSQYRVTSLNSLTIWMGTCGRCCKRPPPHDTGERESRTEAEAKGAGTQAAEAHHRDGVVRLRGRATAG